MSTENTISSHTNKTVGYKFNLFTPDFMRKNTIFDSIEDFLRALNIHTMADFYLLSHTNLYVHVIETTGFSSWHEMMQSASDNYYAQKYNL